MIKLFTYKFQMKWTIVEPLTGLAGKRITANVPYRGR